MAYQVIAVALALLAVLALVVGVRLLANRKWITGFLRGCTGLVVLIGALILAAICTDIASYHVVDQQEVIGTVSFSQKEKNLFQTELQPAGGAPVNAVLSGGQWQLDTRMLKWSPLFKALGFGTGYRFAKLAGKQVEFDPRLLHEAENSAVSLSASRYVDVWAYLAEHPGTVPWLQAYNGGVSFVPMADGAIYEIILSGSNLIARPLNDAARNALANW